MSTHPKYLLRRAELEGAPPVRVRHPLNPRSEIHMRLMSDRTDMKRMGVNMARIPPGKESFLPHAHTAHEEWVYVLEGRGHALIGEHEHEIGPGDFLGFPTDGTVHHLRNSGDVDLVFLQGGERGKLEVGIFPTIGKRMVFEIDRGLVHAVPESTIETIPLSAWLVTDEGEGDSGS